MLLKEMDPTNAMYIVEYGEIEIFLEVDGNEFIIERLSQGSVLNHRVIFTEDNMTVNIRARKPTYIQELSEDDFN
jgi:CRP-like cAMP-binding protein